MPVKFKNSININDQYTLPTQDGTSGQALITDGSGNISFSSTGVPAPLYIDYTNGRLGIGTASPDAELHVNGVIRATGGSYAAATDSLSDVGIVIAENDFIYTADGTDYLRRLIGKTNDIISIGEPGTSLIDGIDLKPGTTGGYVQIFNNTSVAAKFVDGKVGIGTSSPNAKLEVSGSANNADIGIKINNTFDDNNASSNPNSVVFLNAASNNGYLRVHGAPANTAAKHQIDLGSTAATSFLTFSPSSTERMRIDPSGNVGIGTTSPSKKLHVSSNDQSTARIRISNTSASGGDNIDLIAGINNVGQDGFSIHNATSNQTQLVVLGNGNVGIGTTSPSAKLDISSSATGGTTIELDNTSTGGRNWTLYSSGSGNSFGAGKFALYDADAASVRLLVDTSGNVGIGGGTISSKLFVNTDTVGDSYFRGGADNSRFLDFSTFATASPNAGHIINATSVNGEIAFATGGTERMRIDSAGNATFAGNIAVTGTVDGVDISALPTTFAPTNAEQNVNADWASTSGGSQILNNPGTSYLTGVTDRHVFPGLAASGTQARKHHIGRVYYCPKHWDTTWQNIYFTLNEETYNSGYVKYHLYGYYNGTENQTLNLKVVDYRGNNSDIEKYKIVLGDHTDAGWDHSNQNVYYTDIYVEVSHYKSVKVVVDALGHSILHANPTSGAGITVIYPTPTITNITYTNETYDTTYLGSDTKIWNEANDGAGSGLDADKLDGQEGSHYLDYGNFTSTPTMPTDFVSATNGGTFAGNLFVNDQLAVNSTTVNAANKLEVHGQARINGTMMIGNSGISNATNTGQLHIKNSGEAVIRLEDSDNNNLAFDVKVNEGEGFVITETLGGQSGDNNRLVIAETTGNATFSNNVTVTGDLTVNGTTTTLNTQTVEVEDNILQLNTTQGSPDTATAATSGISVYRGNGVTQASLVFDEADDTWDLTNNLMIASKLSVGSSPMFTTGGSAMLSVGGILSIGVSDVDLSYIRRQSAGVFQWQTYDNSNTGEIHLQPYGGNVGIGTTSPSQRLDVREDGTGDVFRGIQVHNNSTANARAGISFKAYDWVQSAIWHGRGTASAYNGALVFGTNPNTSDLSVDGVTGRMWILNNGNVGIGTDSPAVKLDVASQDPVIRITNTKTNLVQNDVVGGLEFFTKDASVGASRVLSAITSDNTTTSATPSGNLIFKTSVGGPGAVAATEKMRITSAGGVSFGSTGTAYGTSGQVLTSSGNTSPTWEDAAAAGGSSTLYRDTFSGNGTTTGFTLGNSVANENLTQIYISGVYQFKDGYTVNGTGINFSTAPPAGTNNIEVISVGAIAVSDEGTLSRNNFIGDGSTTQFTLDVSPTSEDLTYVFLQGVYQEKSTYSLSGNTLTFSTAPQSGYTFEVMSLTATNLSQVTYLANDDFTGTGSQTSFTLVNGTPTNKAFTMVFLSGVYQQKSTYSLTSGAIVFSTAPASNDTIEVVSIGNGGLIGASINDANSAKYNVSVINSSITASAGSVYVFTANLNLTLPPNPSAGESIKISNRSGVDTCQLLRNGSRILGAAADLTLDTIGASFELIYSDATNGWIIIGQ